MDAAQIEALAGILGSRVAKRRENIAIQCPMAPVSHAKGTDYHPSFSVKIDPIGPSACHCFACGVGGTLLMVFTDAQEAVGIYDEALAFIEEHDRGGFASTLARLRMQRLQPAADERGAAFPIEKYVARCMGKVPQYLIDRGLVRSDFERWRIGFDGEMMRAVFPVWDETGQLVGAARRTVLPAEVTWRCRRNCGRFSIEQELCCGTEMRGNAKYEDTPGMPKERVFYGEHAIDPTRGRVHIVEGILDAVFASRVLPNVVAMMGANTGIGPDRLRKLRSWCRAVTLVLDSDAAGNRAWAGWDDPRGRHHPGLRELLKQYFPVSVAHLPAGEDPASVPPGRLLEAVSSATYLGA